MYVEASNPNNPNVGPFTLVSPSFDECVGEVRFHYHLYGSGMGTLQLEETSGEQPSIWRNRTQQLAARDDFTVNVIQMQSRGPRHARHDRHLGGATGCTSLREARRVPPTSRRRHATLQRAKPDAGRPPARRRRAAARRRARAAPESTARFPPPHRPALTLPPAPDAALRRRRSAAVDANAAFSGHHPDNRTRAQPHGQTHRRRLDAGRRPDAASLPRLGRRGLRPRSGHADTAHAGADAGSSPANPRFSATYARRRRRHLRREFVGQRRRAAPSSLHLARDRALRTTLPNTAPTTSIHLLGSRDLHPVREAGTASRRCGTRRHLFVEYHLWRRRSTPRA